MILYLLARSIVLIIGAILSVVPILASSLGWPIDATHIPFVDQYMSDGLGYVRFLAAMIPPLGIIYDGFVFVLYFKVLMFLLRLVRIIH